MTDATQAEASGPPEDGEPDPEAAERSPASPTGALRLPNFRRLWFNNITYFLTFNALRFVFSWFILDGLLRGEREQGYVVFALGIPAFFLVIQAGVWADRWNPRLLLMGTQAASALVFAGTALMIASGQATLGWMMVFAALAGATSAVGQPVRASLIPAIAGQDNLFGAIALNALAMTASMILGPVLVQLVGVRFDFDGAFWFLAILMAVGMLFIRSLEVPERDEPIGPRQSTVADTLEAVRHVIRDPSLRILIMLLAVAGVTVNPAVMITVQAFVKEELGRDSGDAAPLFAAMGIGLAISSFIVMRKGNMPRKGAAFQRAMMVGATMVFLMGRVTSYGQMFPLMLVMGLAGGFYINMNQGLIQSNTPQPLMGRVMGLYTLIQVGFMPIGALVLGIIANSAGIGNTISGAALVALVVVVVTYVSAPRLRDLK